MTNSMPSTVETPISKRRAAWSGPMSIVRLSSGRSIDRIGLRVGVEDAYVVDAVTASAGNDHQVHDYQVSLTDR